MTLQLWLPESARAAYRCLVPKENGQPCGAEFVRGHEEEYQRHVVSCSRTNHEFVDRERPTVKAPGFYGKWDAEYEDWYYSPAGREAQRRGTV